MLDTFETMLASMGLAPAPALLGVTEPVAAEELPALVIAIEQSQSPGNGLGQRSTVVRDGALPWRASINLVNPVLPQDPAFSLLSVNRRELTLPHGGLVRADGSAGPLTAADLEVRVDGVLRTLVGATAAAGEYSANPLTGTLTFGAPLPATGTVAANYLVGQWERRVVRTGGIARLTILAADAATVLALSKQVLEGLSFAVGAPAQGLTGLSVTELGSIAPVAPPGLAARQRAMRLRFDFEFEVNLPDSSGGIIRRIPVQAIVA